jgi:hypothetical protein
LFELVTAAMKLPNPHASKIIVNTAPMWPSLPEPQGFICPQDPPQRDSGNGPAS